MKKIIVPIDFSDCSISGLNFARSIASVLNASLEIIYVQEQDVKLWVLPLGETYLESTPLPREIELKLQQLKSENEKLNISTDIHLQEGNFTEVILDLVASQRADLVVMGTKKSNPAFTKLFGSHASGIVSKKKIPVLIVPDNVSTKEQKFTHQPFVLATDFTGLESIPPFFIELVRKLDVALEVLHISEKNALFESNKLEKLAKDTILTIFDGIKIRFSDNIGTNKIESISEFALEKEAQMLVMISHENGFLDEIYNESQSEKMAYSTQIPLLAIPDQKPELDLESYW